MSSLASPPHGNTSSHYPHPASYSQYGYGSYSARAKKEDDWSIPPSPEILEPKRCVEVKTSDPKVKAVYHRLVALEKEYETCGEAAILEAESEQGFDPFQALGVPQQPKPTSVARIRYKVEVEGDIAALSVNIKALQQAKRSGANCLKERVYQLICRVVEEVGSELSSLESTLHERKMLDDDSRRALSTDRTKKFQEELDREDALPSFWLGKDVTVATRLRERHSCLAKRITQVELMTKAIQGSYFARDLTNTPSFHMSKPVVEGFRQRLLVLKDELPDSDSARSLRSAGASIKGTFNAIFGIKKPKKINYFDGSHPIAQRATPYPVPHLATTYSTYYGTYVPSTVYY